ncbi:hypothetical protein N431DRAFT_435218 [Stipitochalara longipes BDJ]|nr:hypothetical protein N431DRAFT_435218 [Stipitochalara longipes BDJ]
MAKCRICEQPLVIELDPDSFDEAAASSSVGSAITAPDDLLLPCGCHFHWQCLLDEATQIALSLTCPACDNSVVSTSPGPQPHILARYHNEGGVQERLDILPLITEEAYLEANPAARPARAFMTMCAEGDVSGIVELLQNLEEEEESMSPEEILRFQDPLDRMQTGLHVSILRSQQEVVWLLLWLASGLSTQAFPEEVSRAAQVMGADRATARGVDIRSLRDEQGQTGEDLARMTGNVWAPLVERGILGSQA